MKTANELKQIEKFSGDEFIKFNPVVKKHFPKHALAAAFFGKFMIDESNFIGSEWGSIDYILELNKLMTEYQNKVEELHLVVTLIYDNNLNVEKINQDDLRKIFDYTYAVRKLNFISGELHCLLFENKNDSEEQNVEN